MDIRIVSYTYNLGMELLFVIMLCKSFMNFVEDKRYLRLYITYILFLCSICSGVAGEQAEIIEQLKGIFTMTGQILQ